ncbi:hypothetical protein AN963_04035 [Brevibacillus choshinensis]|uniref:Uncharacterized protein n=1 Tax=Brevibacillus choshinensis TaxID=54911 RepID=A0ABR5NBQ2_BRECH|nr:hypothetical protein [Brevibacillus choshinensis]KQL48969.1 hypothetical protein AN963_04035 [Brevibacillus choshinensis]
MEDLFDLLFDLLGWVLPLVGKFWFLILAFIGYKFFGKGAKKMAQGKPRRTLTPVESGGYPQQAPQVERKQVRDSSKYEPVQLESMEGISVEQEWAFAEPDHSLRASVQKQPQTVVQEQAETPVTELDPREGMKWAIIFGEPRAKAPHGSPGAHRRNA